MAYPVFAPQNSWYKGTTAKNIITQINVVDIYNPTGNEAESWNADINDDGSIKCYITGTVLTIAGNGTGKIALNADSSLMFYGTSAETRFTALVTFNGAELLDTSAVTTMYAMFTLCSKLTTINVSNWDTSKVTNMSSTFNLCQSLHTLDVSNWNVSNVTTMTAMFQVCTSLISLDLSGWDVSQVTNMSNMFMSNASYGKMKLNSIGDVGNWNTENVTTMKNMFNNCSSLNNLNVSNWNTNNVTDMSGMFQYCTSLEVLDVSNWNVNKVTTMKSMFSGHSFSYDMKLKTIDVSKWNPASLTHAGWMFYGCAQLTELDLSNWDTTNLTSTEHMFTDCVNLLNVNFSGWNTPNLTTMDAMFNECALLTSIDMSMFNTSKVTHFSQMFEYCRNLTEIIGIEDFDTSSATTMEQMFQGCGINTLNLSKWNVNNVIYFANMFRQSELVNLNLSKWINTSGNASLLYSFMDCYHLKYLDLSGWNMVVKYGYQTFKNCSALEELNLSGIDTSKAIYMEEMFAGMSKLKKIIMGKKFIFNGSGNLGSDAPNPAILPTPSCEYIQNVNGYWYDNSTALSYAPEDVPDQISTIYLAVPAEVTCPVLIKYGTLAAMADAIRLIINSNDKYTPMSMVSIVNKLKIAENLFNILELTGLKTANDKDLTNFLTVENNIITIQNTVYNWGILYWLTQTYSAGTYEISFDVMNTATKEQSPSNRIYVGFGLNGNNNQEIQVLSKYQEWEACTFTITNTNNQAYFFIIPGGGPDNTLNNMQFRNISITLKSNNNAFATVTDNKVLVLSNTSPSAVAQETLTL